MKKFALEHCAWIEAHHGIFTEEEMAYHLQMTDFLKHERAVHLPVMLATVFGLLFLVGYALFSPSYIVLAGILLDAILSFFYLMHYYFLENTVQSWYKVYRDWFLNGNGDKQGLPS